MFWIFTASDNTLDQSLENLEDKLECVVATTGWLGASVEQTEIIRRDVMALGPFSTYLPETGSR